MLSKSIIIKKINNLDKPALRGEPLPDDLSLPEQMYYLSVRRLYKDWKAEIITEEEARAEKKKITDGYVDTMYQYQMWKHYAEIHDIFDKEFYRQGTLCEKCGECRLYKILVGLIKG